MSGRLNKNILLALQQANYEQIVQYIVEICEAVANDFEFMNRRLPNNENQIRTIILEEYLDNDEIRRKHGMSEYSFSPETMENYDGNGNYIGRADIRIKLKTDFEKREAYYIVECKRLDGKMSLNKKYVGEGVSRFITKKYSSYYGKNIMLGFVIKQIDISNNAVLIERYQNTDNSENMYGSFDLVAKRSKSEVYKCQYKIEKGDLELRHIFIDYSGIIEG